MKLFYKLSDNYNPNYIVKHIDNSFGSDDVYFDFQVALTDNRSLILNFDIYSKKCVSCEGYLSIDKRAKNENIVIEKFSNGELLIELEDFEKEVPLKEYLLEDYVDLEIANKIEQNSMLLDNQHKENKKGEMEIVPF